MNNLKQIMTFIAVAESGSFTLAASKLHLSTMAVSKQIKNLEESITEQLFIRSTRQVRLSEFGSRFYHHCKKLERSWQELEEFVGSQKLEPQGKLTVCVSRAFGQELFLSKLKEFSALYPKIRLEVVLCEGHKIANFETEEYDILFGFPEFPSVTDGLKYKKLYDTKNILCASKEFIEKYGRPEKPEDLVNFKFINHSLREPKNVLPLANGQSVLTSDPVIIMNSFEGLTQACVDGFGIYLTGDLLIEKQLQEGRLEVLLPDLNYREFELHLFYRAMQYEQPSIRAFIDFYAPAT